MISLPRSALARFRAVLRRGLPRAAGSLPVSIRSGSRGRGLEVVTPEIALRLLVPGRGPAEHYVVAADALDEVAAFDDSTVTIAPADGGQVGFAYEDDGAARHRHYPALADKGPAFPNVPRDLTPIDASFLMALAAAAPLAPKQPTRYALNRLLLDGATGQVVATDGKQLFVQGRWAFPWDDHALIPAGTVWTCRELLDEPVALGRTPGHVVVASGPWTIAIALDRQGRYPPYGQIIPPSNRWTTRVRFSEADRDLIVKQLPKVPGDDADPPPVTLVIDRGVELQAGEVGLVAPAATVTGPPVRITMDRRMLVRALRLGFTELGIVAADVPGVFADERRQYLVMPLTPPQTAAAPAPESLPVPVVAERAEPSTNGLGVEPLPDPIAEVESIRGLLRAADGRLARLLGHLKHHRRHTRALQSALASLRSLPEFVH